MGNLCSGGNGVAVDEENNLAMSLAEAVATGAREGISDAFQAPRQDQQSALLGVLIGGSLPMVVAKEAATAGAERALEARVKELNFAARFSSGIIQVKIAAGYGAKAGLDEIEHMVMQADVEVHGGKVINLEVAAAAAATGARVACLIAMQKFLTPNASRYAALLGPMFGGSFPTSAAVYNLIKDSSDIVKLCGFGGITLAVFVISSGLAAGLLGRTAGSACYTRFATLAAVVIVLSLFTCALCTLFSSGAYQIACGCICGALIFFFVLAWFIFRW